MRKNDGRRLNHKTLEEIRIRTVRQVQSGESPEVLAKTLGFRRSTVYNWLAMYRAGGWSALKAKPLAGRPKKISGPQMQWLYRTIVRGSPLQYRFEFALWTRQMVRILLWEEFRLQLSLASVSRLLAQLGLSCQRPVFRASEQDPERVRVWRERDYPLIRELAKQERAQIFFGDESAVRTDYHSGTSWGIKGKTPVVSGTGHREKVNMISAITPRGEMRFMIFTGTFNGTRFVEFLQRLLHKTSSPIFLILDSHPVHRSLEVKDWLATQPATLRLFFLPPYSPELNPDELVWNHVKNHGTGRRGLVRGELKKVVKSRLHSLQHRPGTVRSFFLHPDTKYAAIA